MNRFVQILQDYIILKVTYESLTASVTEKPLSTPAAVIIPDVSSGDKDRMEGERARMATERDHIREERLERQREQEGLDEERHRFQTERQRLQGELSEAVQVRHRLLAVGGMCVVAVFVGVISVCCCCCCCHHH